MSYGLRAGDYPSTTRRRPIGLMGACEPGETRRVTGEADSGFSLIEVLIAVVLIGMAITALLGANGAFTMVNAAGADLTTSEFLIEQIHELTAMASAEDLFALNGLSPINPPIDAGRNEIADLAAFSQVVTAAYADANDFEPSGGAQATQFVKVTVSITRNGRTLNSASWIRANY